MSEGDDIYAARIARNMWRAAKRRMANALSAPKAAVVRNCDPQKRRAAPLQGSAPEAEAGPRNLPEFLQALKKELEQDDEPPASS